MPAGKRCAELGLLNNRSGSISRYWDSRDICTTTRATQAVAVAARTVINIDNYDENGLLTRSLVDWPHPAESVRAAIADRKSGPSTSRATIADVPFMGARFRTISRAR